MSAGPGLGGAQGVSSDAFGPDPFERLSAMPVSHDARVVDVPDVPALPMAMIGRLHGFDLLDRPLLADVPAAPGRLLAARSVVALRHAQIGVSLVLAFEGGDVERPIVLGVLDHGVLGPTESAARPRVEAVIDGERRVIEAEREIVLRCGAASITLTRAGKVLIEGQQIVSRAAGVNRIKGAAVDIN